MNKLLTSVAVIVLNPLLFIVSVFAFYYIYLKSMPGITSDSDVILAHVSQIAGSKSVGAMLATIIMPVVFIFKGKWKLHFFDMVKWYSIPFWGISVLWIVLLSNKI